MIELFSYSDDIEEIVTILLVKLCDSSIKQYYQYFSTFVSCKPFTNIFDITKNDTLEFHESYISIDQSYFNSLFFPLLHLSFFQEGLLFTMQAFNPLTLFAIALLVALKSSSVTYADEYYVSPVQSSTRTFGNEDWLEETSSINFNLTKSPGYSSKTESPKYGDMQTTSEGTTKTSKSLNFNSTKASLVHSLS